MPDKRRLCTGGLEAAVTGLQATGVAADDFFIVGTIFARRQVLPAGALPHFERDEVQFLLWLFVFNHNQTSYSDL